MWAYHTFTRTWTKAGVLPKDPAAGVWPPVTAATLQWGKAHIVPSGEARPGIRTPQVLSGTPVVHQSPGRFLDYAAVVLYLGILVAIGFYFARRERSTEDFFLAGRRIPWWAAGLSIFGTQLSAITFMAIPAKAYATNWLYAMSNVGIIVFAPIVVWCFLPFYRRLNVTTVYEYLELRFNLATRLFGSAAYILFPTGADGHRTFPAGPGPVRGDGPRRETLHSRDGRACHALHRTRRH